MTLAHASVFIRRRLRQRQYTNIYSSYTVFKCTTYELYYIYFPFSDFEKNKPLLTDTI